MIWHTVVGNNIYGRKRKIKSLIRSGEIVFGGNRKLKIYGTLTCSSGKKMKTGNRIFFCSEQEALAAGYRPCGHCMNQEYKIWKENKNETLG